MLYIYINIHAYVYIYIYIYKYIIQTIIHKSVSNAVYKSLCRSMRNAVLLLYCVQHHTQIIPFVMMYTMANATLSSTVYCSLQRSKSLAMQELFNLTCSGHYGGGTLYIHIYICTCVCICIYLSIYLSLSLYIYIYTYVYPETRVGIRCQPWRPDAIMGATRGVKKTSLRFFKDC